MVVTAIGGPDRIVWYVSDTLDRAVGIMWDDQSDGLPAVLRQLGLLSEDEARDQGATEWHYSINLTQHKVTFRNGSYIRLYGADRAHWSGFRGKKADLLVIDEMQRQHQESLEQALKADLPDCFAARRGTIMCIGTVGPVLTGVWYELATGLRRGWNDHHWTAEQLSHVTNVWAEQLAEAEAMGIDIDTDPAFLREKRGIWVRDVQNLVHVVTDSGLWDGGDLPQLIRTRCNEHARFRGRCRCQLPMVPRTQPQIVVAGLDLGAGDGTPGNGDPCAVCVLSVSPEEWIIRELWSEQRFCPTTDLLVSWLRETMGKYTVRQFYVDPAWKMTGNDLGQLHGLPMMPAVKGDAEGTTEDLWHMERATALQQGTMLVRRGGVLQAQLETILRDPKELQEGHIRAMGGQDDHVFDAWRYGFRMLRTRHAQAPEQPLTAQERESLAAAQRKERALERGPQTQQRRWTIG